MKILNKLLNIYLIILVIFICLYLIITFIQPVFYSANSKGKEFNDSSEYIYIYQSLYKYITYYKEQDIESLKKCTSLLKRKNETDYIKVYDEKIKDKFKGIEISNIEESFNNVYIIEYSINVDYNDITIAEPDTQKLIIRLDHIKRSFTVLYDSLIELN